MKKGFTLIELLVVIALMAILMGIAVPAFKGSSRGSKARTAFFQINSHFQLARQMAITTRQNVYVVFPDDQLSYPPENDWAYSSYAVYGEKDGYVGEWRRLPAGILFYDDFEPKAGSNYNILQQGDPYLVEIPFPDMNGSPQEMLAITFRPDGHLSVAGSSIKGVYITEGWFDKDDDHAAGHGYRPNATVMGLEFQPITGQAKPREYTQ